MAGEEGLLDELILLEVLLEREVLQHHGDQLVHRHLAEVGDQERGDGATIWSTTLGQDSWPSSLEMMARIVE